MGKVTQSIDWIRINLIKLGTLCPYTKLVWVSPHLVLCELWFQQNQIIAQENDSYAVNFYSSGSWMNKFLYSVFCNKVYYEILSSSLLITVCNNFFLSYSDYTNLKQWSSSEEGVSVRTPLYLRCLHYCKIMGN